MTADVHVYHFYSLIKLVKMMEEQMVKDALRAREDMRAKANTSGKGAVQDQEKVQELKG